MPQKFKVTFTLEESDVKYFRDRYRKAKREVKQQDVSDIIQEARDVVKEVRGSKKTPRFVREAIETLADLTDLIQDDTYAAPKRVRDEVLAAIAYFSNPEDLIPDDIPVLGFLDDAIMIKFIEEEFKHELWGYRKFCKSRDLSEQRPWARPGSDRLAKRLEEDRKKIRDEITRREEKAGGSTLGG